MLTPREARKAWIAALRSGEFKQGDGALSTGTRHCCLGVACELALRDGLKFSKKEREAFDGTAENGSHFGERAPELDRSFDLLREWWEHLWD